MYLPNTFTNNTMWHKVSFRSRVFQVSIKNVPLHWPVAIQSLPYNFPIVGERIVSSILFMSVLTLWEMQLLCPGLELGSSCIFCTLIAFTSQAPSMLPWSSDLSWGVLNFWTLNDPQKPIILQFFTKALTISLFFALRISNEARNPSFVLHTEKLRWFFPLQDLLYLSSKKTLALTFTSSLERCFKCSWKL